MSSITDKQIRQIQLMRISNFESMGIKYSQIDHKIKPYFRECLECGSINILEDTICRKCHFNADGKVIDYGYLIINDENIPVEVFMGTKNDAEIFCKLLEKTSGLNLSVFDRRLPCYAYNTEKYG
jgi:hypothetical protein